jgi:hypothetical protein
MKTIAIFLVSLAALAVSAAEKPQWKPADPAVACADVKDRALCVELLGLLDADQIARYASLEHPEGADEAPEVKAVDRKNQARIHEIVDKYGWPGKSLVGVKAGGAAWTLVQHADLATQERYIDRMTAAADAGEIEWALVATTIDRIQVRRGKPQTYGTQFHTVDGELKPQPIADEEHVDERRAKVGLPPLAQYTALMKQMYARPAPPKE